MIIYKNCIVQEKNRIFFWFLTQANFIFINIKQRYDKVSIHFHVSKKPQYLEMK